jgi:hypothetical protein
VLVDRFEQADAGVAEKGAELGIDFEFAAQAMKTAPKSDGRGRPLGLC